VPFRGTAFTRVAHPSAGHDIEFWLAVCAAAGLVVSGWLCLTPRAVNALCAVAAAVAMPFFLLGPEVRAMRRRDAGS
jgi:hypothetical protein